jgi:hypothetical protein
MDFIKNRTVLIGLAVLLGLSLLYVVGQRTNVLPRVNPAQMFSEKYDVKRIDVIEGHEFDLLLRDDGPNAGRTYAGKRIHARLAINTPKEAKDRVVAHINLSTGPQVILHEQQEGTWIVDLLFNEGSLTDWLNEEGLVWE